MAEWHVTPDYIIKNWTDELLDLMIGKLIERKKAERKPTQPADETVDNKVSDKMLFAQAGNMIKVETR